MTDYKPVLDPRHIGDMTVTTVRWPLENESGHEVRLNGHVVVVRPDSRTTSKKRSWAISRAAVRPVADEGDRLALLVGSLLLAGAHRVEVDGVPLVPESPRVVEWVVELGTDGSVAARFQGA